jgi:hypothetical protein
MALTAELGRGALLTGSVRGWLCTVTNAYPGIVYTRVTGQQSNFN